mmetsp:Transcript_42016/g.67546  ORF Transcript_42016/g.67546 Transcript_42016/m.67546 type:complete len:170 (+) Transcript_42016:41-550(+)
MERLRALLRKTKSKQKKLSDLDKPSVAPQGDHEPKLKTAKPKTKKAPKEKGEPKKSKRGKITIVTSKPSFMTDEEFHAFIRRLKYYNLCYMNLKMYVGIDENCITDDAKSVLANIKKAIRRNMSAVKGVQITEDSIIENSVYATDQIKILKLETILEPIDETKPMIMAA